MSLRIGPGRPDLSTSALCNKFLASFGAMASFTNLFKPWPVVVVVVVVVGLVVVVVVVLLYSASRSASNALIVPQRCEEMSL